MNFRIFFCGYPVCVSSADIEVACYTYEGVDAVKAALRGGLALATEEMPIKINLIAPPLYVVTTQTLERQEGLALLNTAVQRIQELIEAAGGVFDMKQAVSWFLFVPNHFISTLMSDSFIAFTIEFLSLP